MLKRPLFSMRPHTGLFCQYTEEAAVIALGEMLRNAFAQKRGVA